MTGYFKKVAYLDYLENGMKLRNAGFLKLERSNGRIRLEVRVKNAPEQFSGQYEITADCGGIAARISLSHGSGGCCAVWETGKTVPQGMRWEKVNSVYIRLPERRLIQAVWDEPLEMLLAGEREEKMPETPAETLPETPLETPPEAQPETLPETQPEMPLETPPETPPEAPLEATPEAGELQTEERKEEEPVCYSDKWTQLCHMYPILHPFRDDREYLSIAPKDFVVLRQEYQKLVHNSFLLHGYYNYRHLILGRILTPDRRGFQIWLGVPGNFYDREKMVAEMFGFEGFEGTDGQEKPGDFGYFLKRVEI